MGSSTSSGEARALTQRSSSGCFCRTTAPTNLSIQYSGRLETAATPASTGMRILSGSVREIHDMFSGDPIKCLIFTNSRFHEAGSGVEWEGSHLGAYSTA
jgi:hypothetical protein